MNNEIKKYPLRLIKELNKLKKHKDDMTTSDLQGAVMVLCKKYFGEYDDLKQDDMLRYIYEES